MIDGLEGNLVSVRRTTGYVLNWQHEDHLHAVQQALQERLGTELDRIATILSPIIASTSSSLASPACYGQPLNRQQLLSSQSSDLAVSFAKANEVSQGPGRGLILTIIAYCITAKWFHLLGLHAAFNRTYQPGRTGQFIKVGYTLRSSSGYTASDHDHYQHESVSESISTR